MTTSKSDFVLMFSSDVHWGWSGCAMVLGKLPVPRRPTIWIIVGQGSIALAVGADGGCLDIFTLLYLCSPFSPSQWAVKPEINQPKKKNTTKIRRPYNQNPTATKPNSNVQTRKSNDHTTKSLLAYNVETTLNQRPDNESTLILCSFNVKYFLGYVIFCTA